MLKVLIATGGSGGHLFPSRQLAEKLADCEILFAGYQLETTPFFDRSVPYAEICSTPSKKKWPFLLKGIWQSLRLLFRFKPDVVVGFGSFHSFPVLMGAVLLRKKIILFEPNCSLGKVNRFFSPFARKVAIQFPLSVQSEKMVYVPLLPWVVKRRESPKKYRKKEGKTTILVFGGSQGAAFINRTFFLASRLLAFPFEVIHLTGKEPISLDYSVPAEVKPFEEDMASLYEAADLAVCRCGAGTIAELIRYRLPSVLIPYPYAHGHQQKNGEYLKEGARLLLQGEATPERLALEIESVKRDLQKHKDALERISMPKTTDLSLLVRTIGEKK